MLPIIYPATETDFTSRGYGALADCVSCTVTEVLNGEYSLSLRYLKNGINQEHLQVRNIIICRPRKNAIKDAFRISKVNRSMKDYITVTAYHLSYDLTGYPVLPVTEPVTGTTIIGTNLLDSAPNGSVIWEIPSNTAFEFISAEKYDITDWYKIKVLTNGYIGWVRGSLTTLSRQIGLRGAVKLLNDACNGDFTITTNKTSVASFNVDVPSSVRSWFGGKEGSLIDIYGGEWLYHLWRCELREHRGADNGVRLSYGTNLSKYVKEITDTVYSEIVPYYNKQSDGGSVVVTGNSISTGITSIQRAFYLDVSDKFGDNYGKIFNLKLKARVWKTASSTTPWTEASEDRFFFVTADLSRIIDWAYIDNWTVIADDAFSFSAVTGISNPAQGVAFPVKVEPSTRYRFSCITNSYGKCVTVSYANAGGTKLSIQRTLTPVNGVISGEFVTPDNATWAVLVFLPTTWNQICTWSNIRMDSRPAVADVTAQGQSYLSAHPEIASDSMTISVEAEILAVDANLGDTVHVIYDDAVVDSRIVKTIWDAVAERYTSLEIGTAKQNIAQTIKLLR